jgi:aspartate/methionine/tyrosine aminotransferase
VNVDPGRILITPGGSGALLLAASLLVDPVNTGYWPIRVTLQPAFSASGEGAACARGATRHQLTADLVAQH